MSLKVKIKKRLNRFTLDIEFESDTGASLGILGSSGSGKSMTLKCIAGIEKPDSGFIQIDDDVVYDGSAKIFKVPQKRRVGYLFQNYALFPKMTVFQNISCGINFPPCLRGGGGGDIVNEYIVRFGLEGLEDALPEQLSGGQQQRVALARMLASNPKAFLFDEPFSALDENLREKMQFEFLRLLKSSFQNTILVSHSRSEIYKLCDSTLVFEEGKIIAAGDTRQVFKNPGSVGAAKLTGCKNISTIKKISEHSFYAVDWGVELKTESFISDDIIAAGVRAHNFFTDSSQVDKTTNILNVHSYNIQSGLFEDAVVFKCTAGGAEIWYLCKTPAMVHDKIYLSGSDILLLRR